MVTSTHLNALKLRKVFTNPPWPFTQANMMKNSASDHTVWQVDAYRAAGIGLKGPITQT